MDKPEIATVDSNGLLTSVSEGVVLVTASDKDSTGIAGEITINVTVDHTSVDQAISAQMRIYPNPADEIINIENAFEINRVAIINHSGQVVMEISNSDLLISLDIVSLQTGIYLLKITSVDGKTKTGSFIKN